MFQCIPLFSETEVIVTTMDSKIQVLVLPSHEDEDDISSTLPHIHVKVRLIFVNTLYFKLRPNHFNPNVFFLFYCCRRMLFFIRSLTTHPHLPSLLLLGQAVTAKVLILLMFVVRCV